MRSKPSGSASINGKGCPTLSEQATPWVNRIVGHGDESPEQLIANPRNWRIHPQRQQQLLNGVISDVGYLRSVTVNRRTGFVLDGHLRVSMAISSGQQAIPVEYVDLSEAEEAEALAVLDPIAGMAATDAAQLEALIGDIDVADEAVLAFLDEQLDLLRTGAEPAGLTDPDAVPDVPEQPTSKRQDVWCLGQHRLMCGDSTSEADMAVLMAGERAAMIFTDPPYGVEVRLENAHEASNAAKGIDAVYRHFDPVANDGLAGPELAAFLEHSFRVMRSYAEAGAAYYVWHAFRSATIFEAAAVAAGVRFFQQIIWAKPHFVFGRAHYHWQHEPCFYGWVPGERPMFSGQRNQGTVWESELGGGAIRKDQLHPTQKPVELANKAINNSTPSKAKLGAIVLDAFGGSGSTLIGAHQLQRRAYLMEIDPKYVDVACRRYQEYTGDQPVLEATGVAHDFTSSASE